LNRPDFRTISDFRKRYLSALADLFKPSTWRCIEMMGTAQSVIVPSAEAATA
jgi:hypothetical protein